VAVHYQLTGRTAAAISASVEAGIRHGSMGPGAALPPVRQLADELGVSPATVGAAYRALRERGLVETAGRNGTRVRRRPPVAARLSRRPTAGPDLIELSTAEPDLELLPDPGPVLRRIAAGVRPRGYVHASLPELLAAARARLAPVDTTHLTLANGALDAIERVFSAQLRPGDRVAVEDPGWANLLDLVAALGLVPVPVAVDEDGPRPAALAAVLRHGVAAFALTSRAQNPFGAYVSATRSTELRAVLAPYPQVLIVEDDHAAELAGGPLHPVVGVTPTWAFVRSVSKPYGPDLRLAVLAGDESTVARVEGRSLLGAGWVSTILQQLVLELWSDPAVTAQVVAAGQEYGRRRTCLREALAERGLASYGRSGINVWVPVVDETLAVTRVRDAGFAIAPGSLYRIATPPAVRVSVGPLRPPMIEPLADALAAATTARPSV
jgi:DNA-binding transcriptional MocR family regulator